MGTKKKITAGIILFLVLLSPHNLFCQINIGDTLQFWSVAYIDWQPNPAIQQRIVTAACKSIGNECYIFIDTEINNPPSDQQINSLVNIFDTVFVPKLTPLYGPVPDEFDNDPKVFILLIPNEGWIGYFDPAHQMADSFVTQIWNKHSNQKEIIFLSDDVFNYGADIVLAHEFGHMLHFGRDHSPEPPQNPIKYWEDEWIDEAFATFSPVYLIEDIAQQNVYDYSAFFAYETGVSLIHFDGANSYDLVKLWMTFMWEHFGEANFISTLINDQNNGIAGVVNALVFLGYTETFDQVFEQWVIANYLDNKNYLGGKYGYAHYNFPPCLHSATHTQIPTGINTGSLSAYASDYIRFSSSTPQKISIHFDGTDTSEFRLIFLKLGNENSQIYSIDSVLPDSLNNAIFQFDSLGGAVKKIIMIVMNTDASLNENQKADYEYSAEIILDTVSDQENIFNYSLQQNYPNPFNPMTKIKYSVPISDVVQIKIYDIMGKEITILLNEYKQAGTYQIDFDASSLPSGVYFYRMISGSYSETKKMILLR